MDDAEDVDMDGDDREGEGDEQDDEEMIKGGDENAPIDISMDQDNSQIPLTSPTIDGNTLPTQVNDNGNPQQGPTNQQIASQGDDNPHPSSNEVREDDMDTDAAPVTVSASSSTEAPQDIAMNGTSQSVPISQEAPVAETASIERTTTAGSSSPSGFPTSQPIPSSNAVTTDDIKRPDVDACPLPEASATEEAIAPMDMEVEQPLERPEDSTDALALPVASSVPMPAHVSAEALLEMSSVASGPMEAAPIDLLANVEPIPQTNPTEPEGTPDAPPLIEESPALVEEPSAAEMKRSLTPSPSPERIQEFKEHAAAIEEPTLVPGNLPSPSPQLDPPSIVSPPPAPSNAVEGAVAGAHVTDVQLGGGALGAESGEVALESTSHGAETEVAREVTMEGEADPGKSLGEGDPVGVNGQEQFADEDVRRADDTSTVVPMTAPAGEDSTAVQTEKTE